MAGKKEDRVIQCRSSQWEDCEERGSGGEGMGQSPQPHEGGTTASSDPEGFSRKGELSVGLSTPI